MLPTANSIYSFKAHARTSQSSSISMLHRWKHEIELATNRFSTCVRLSPQDISLIDVSNFIASALRCFSSNQYWTLQKINIGDRSASYLLLLEYIFLHPKILTWVTETSCFDWKSLSSDTPKSPAVFHPCDSEHSNIASTPMIYCPW